MRRALIKLFWASLAAGAAVYSAMLTWTLPVITAQAGGLAPFDMRPGGYSTEEAQAFAAALTPEGRALYLGAQHWLDLAYPLLLGLALFSGIALLTPAALGRLKWLLPLTAVPATLFDWRENALVSRMLRQDGPLDPGLVAAASRATALKSAFSAVAMTLLLILLLIWLWRRWQARNRMRGNGTASPARTGDP